MLFRSSEDAAAALRLAPIAVKVEDHRALGGAEDDALLVASTAPAKQNLPAGCLVYRIDRGGPMRGDTPPGLYRWLLPGEVDAFLGGQGLDLLHHQRVGAGRDADFELDVLGLGRASEGAGAGGGQQGADER